MIITPKHSNLVLTVGGHFYPIDWLFILEAVNLNNERVFLNYIYLIKIHNSILFLYCILIKFNIKFRKESIAQKRKCNRHSRNISLVKISIQLRQFNTMKITVKGKVLTLSGKSIHRLNIVIQSLVMMMDPILNLKRIKVSIRNKHGMKFLYNLLRALIKVPYKSIAYTKAQLHRRKQMMTKFVI